MVSLAQTSVVNTVVGSASQLQTLVLSVEDTRHIVEHVGLDALMDEMIARLIQAFEQFDPAQTVVPVRTGFSYEQPHVGLVEWMPLFEKHRQIVVKAVGYHPQNPSLYKLPTVLSTVSAYDPKSGHLTAVIDGTFLTALRTGAASAIATQHLASPDSQILGLIGVGAQAVTQLHGLSRCFDLKQVLIFDRDPAVSQTFTERIACLGLDHLDICQAEISDIVATADILCTATSVDVGHGPVFPDQSLKPWLHVNAVGADFPGKFEVPLSLLERSFVCPDFREQAICEGECQQLKDLKSIGSELSNVVKNPAQYRHYQQRFTVFDSTGFALEDQVAMNMLLDYATELSVGTLIKLESATAEVKNPYSFVL
ncbi:ornithine cyclodeaminase family protein [Leptolyngbya cf. ectocarpi LEGE 11479]|uniref:Ornithine cyclodeaminase family protein n=1 Tax=Leptolyngbya cf. ectocarpi LEGE 11479 TaxID=1828722 RepID=A0A928ZSW3_LEPEC|nr:ornithine cyclodeaminase family protein [Leptolyngbya ectocarpi]MBE9066942.1 ornithine cyclodeaminase family protein [Leptolyngbya cf. ectocarpi LEGE 11479]